MIGINTKLAKALLDNLSKRSLISLLELGPGTVVGNLLMKNRLQVAHSRLCTCSTGVTPCGHSDVYDVETRFSKAISLAPL